MKSNLCRAIIEETKNPDEKFFSDYLRFRETDFPDHYINALSKYGKIEILDISLQRIVEDIYAN